MHPWAQAIDADGKGVLSIDVRDGTAIANATNAYDRVLDDVIQIGWILQNDVAASSRAPTLRPYRSWRAARPKARPALWRMYQAGIIAAEYETIHPLLLMALTPAGIHLTHPLKSRDNLGGAKLIVASKVNADAINLLGGSPLSIPLFEMYAGDPARRCAGLRSILSSSPKLGAITSIRGWAPRSR